MPNYTVKRSFGGNRRNSVVELSAQDGAHLEAAGYVTARGEESKEATKKAAGRKPRKS